MLDRLEQWARHPLALVAVFIGALAEATAFPVAPDLLLIFWGLGYPRRWLAYGLIALAGSLAGGLITYFDAAGGGTLASGRTLMVTPRMEAAAWQSLAEGGAAALLTQAFGGVPYKVYAALAPSAGIPLSEFLLASALGRGARLLPVAAVAAFARRRLGKLIEERFAWAALAILMGFFALLGVVVMVWS